MLTRRATNPTMMPTAASSMRAMKVCVMLMRTHEYP